MLAVGWIGARMAILWPEGGAELRRLPAVVAHADLPTLQRRPLAIGVMTGELAATGSLPARRSQPALGLPRSAPASSHRATDAEMLAAVGLLYFVEVRPPQIGTIPWLAPSPAPASVAALTDIPSRSRWTLDGWFLTRGGAAGITPILGGRQAGLRLGYVLDDRRRASAYARATTPLNHDGTELAAGLQWQPTRAPVAAFAEARRRPGGALVPSAGVVSGVYQLPVSRTWRLDGYGQAGLIGARLGEGFADGQLRLTRPVKAVGIATIEAGAALWGAAQRDVARLDIGPTLGVALPLWTGNLRLTADWRQRIAGRAAPASGPALTLAAGF